MGKLGLRILAPAVALLLAAAGASAHASQKHKAADAQMQKLHDMMPMFSRALANLESAVEKRDAAAVEAEAGRMLAALPDLKKSRPHKNLTQLKTFRALAGELERDLKGVAGSVKSSDFEKAKTALSKAESTCAACHALFRD